MSGMWGDFNWESKVESTPMGRQPPVSDGRPPKTGGTASTREFSTADGKRQLDFGSGSVRPDPLYARSAELPFKKPQSQSPSDRATVSADLKRRQSQLDRQLRSTPSGAGPSSMPRQFNLPGSIGETRQSAPPDVRSSLEPSNERAYLNAMMSVPDQTRVQQISRL